MFLRSFGSALAVCALLVSVVACQKPEEAVRTPGALIRAANGDYYMSDCVKAAKGSQNTIERECKFDLSAVKKNTSKTGRGIYTGYTSGYNSSWLDIYIDFYINTGYLYYYNLNYMPQQQTCSYWNLSNSCYKDNFYYYNYNFSYDYNPYPSCNQCLYNPGAAYCSQSCYTPTPAPTPPAPTPPAPAPTPPAPQPPAPAPPSDGMVDAVCVGGPAKPSYAFFDVAKANNCSALIASMGNDCRSYVQVRGCRAYAWDVGVTLPRNCICNPQKPAVGYWR